MTAIEFVRRGTRKLTSTAELMRWRSRCGRFAVVEVRSLLREEMADGGVRLPPPRYLAVRACGHGEVVVSRHRVRHAAERSIRKAVRRG